MFANMLQVLAQLNVLHKGYNSYKYFCIDTTYRSRFIPEGVAEVYHIFLRDAYELPKLFSYE
jgi:hypothetical protein